MGAGGFDYVEIAVSDMRRAADFYGALFGWDFNTAGPPDYWGFAAGRGRGAILRHESRAVGGDNPIVYVTVDDLDAVLERVETAGGRVERGASPVPGQGRFAHLRDPDGTRIGVWEVGQQSR